MRLDRWVPRRRPKREPLIRPEDILLSKRITWRIDEPFTIFESDRFLDDELAARLQQEFPWTLLEAQFKDGQLRARVDQRQDAVKFRNVLRGSELWRDLFDAMRSRAFRKDALQFIRPALVKRARVQRQVLSWLYLAMPLWLTETKFDFTAYTRGFYLSPHNDDERKLLALMIYVEDRNRTTESALGTGFWRAKSQELESSWYSSLAGLPPAPIAAQPLRGLGLRRIFREGDQLNSSDESFRREFERFRVARFSTNRAAGFAKARNSWHDVDLREMPSDVIRGALLVNINIRVTPRSIRKRIGRWSAGVRVSWRQGRSKSQRPRQSAQR